MLIRYLTIVRTCTYCRRPCRTADESHTGRRRRVWFESERSERKRKKLKSARKAGMWKEGKRPPGSRNALPRSFRFPTGRHPHLWGDGRMDRSAYNFSAASGNGRVIHNCVSRLPMYVLVHTTTELPARHNEVVNHIGPRKERLDPGKSLAFVIAPASNASGPFSFSPFHSFPACQE